MELLPSGLRYRHWRAGHGTKAVLLLAHGLGEHSGRYGAFVGRCNARDIAVVAPDHMGHGQSPGERVFLKRFDDYLGGMRECRAVIAQDYPQLPCFLFGHSMGGLIAARLLLQDQSQYQGAMLSGPAFAVAAPPPAPVMWLGRLLARLTPKAGMLALDGNGVSRDPEVVAAYGDDPLVHHGKVTAGLGVALIDAMAQTLSQASTITLPMIVMHGGADTLAAPAGSEMFFQGLGSSDKTLRLLPGLYHEILNEPEGDSIAMEYIQWLEDRL